MSRGPGRVQSAIIAAFQADPTRKFTVRELAEIAFPGVPITANHTSAVSRALNAPALRDRLDLNVCRTGHRRTGGWSHVFGRAC